MSALIILSYCVGSFLCGASLMYLVMIRTYRKRLQEFENMENPESFEPAAAA